MRRYYRCMTKEKKNSVRVISNAVLVRSEADSNRCIRFCRPLPSHSAIRPFVLSCRPPPRSPSSPRSPLNRAPRVGAEHGVGDVRPANIQKNIYLPKLRQIFDSFSEKYYFYSTVDTHACTVSTPLHTARPPPRGYGNRRHGGRRIRHDTI